MTSRHNEKSDDSCSLHQSTLAVWFQSDGLHDRLSVGDDGLSVVDLLLRLHLLDDLLRDDWLHLHDWLSDTYDRLHDGLWLLCLSGRVGQRSDEGQVHSTAIATSV
jgi:hypothetical protein